MTLFPTSGFAANGKPILDWNGAAAQLTRSGNSWSFSLGTPATITYGFRATAPATMPNGVSGFQQFNSAQIIAAEAALQLWSDVANITFTRVGSGTSGAAAYSNSATILFANYTTETDPASAFAYLAVPGATGAGNLAGDVWVDASESDNRVPVFGGWGPHALAHEIGHAIGINHPGDYDGGSPTYQADAVYWQDARMFTVMSYFGSTNTGGVIPTFAWGPQYHDIAAAQRLYGANMTTRTGDTTYGFSSNSGRSLFEISSASQGVTFSIWDAGGNDTLDLSGYVENAEIDLRPGAFSSAGPSADRGAARYNISIAVGVIIENAVGGAGADFITGNDANNALFGRGGGDQIFGWAGNDSLHGEAGNDSLNGGAGADNLDGGADADQLDGGDGYLLTSFEGSIFRLYQATLDRAPDEPGFDDWSGQLAGGTPLLSIVTGFMQSVEFQQTFGSLNDSQFVTLLYNNVLGRAPDTEGFNNWTGALAAGMSRESVVLGFSESQEFKNLTSISSSAFATTVANDEAIGEVFRLYQATLGRAPDEGGFINWTNALAVHALTLMDAVTGFVQSAEFQQAFGSLNDSQFVTLLYNNVLGRAPDPAGFANWTGALAAGASRESVVLGFSESLEFKNATASSFMTFMRTGLPSLADTLTGGVGDDILFGGAGADSFNFIQGAGGSDTVFGYEAYDTLSLSGFGYVDAADALTRFTQAGTDVVFQDQGQTILFAETNLAAIQNSNLLII